MSTSPLRDFTEPLSSSDSFHPPWMFRNGHLQTLAGMYVFAPWAGRRQISSLTSTTGEVLLPDGDRLIFQDECPLGWKPGDRVALLLHGLSGSHASPYVSRIARLLNQQNVRTCRLDWRGCGAGVTLTRYPYHSGRSDDLAAAIAEINARCAGSSITLIGFSLGGNVTLKLLGEPRDTIGDLAGVDRAIAVCPPIDLLMTVRSLGKGLAQFYDRYFCNACVCDVRHRQRVRPDALVPDGWHSRQPRTLYEFDDTFTAPVCGFESAIDYYSRSGASQFLPGIHIPTLIIAAQDDPVIPFQQYKLAEYSQSTKLLAPRHGGHMGFCTPRGLGWLDQQIVSWTVRNEQNSPAGAT